jgi:Nif-specific regulatory protein
MDDFACRRNECLSAMLWKGHSDLAPQHLRPPVSLPILPVAPAAGATTTPANTSSSLREADPIATAAGAAAANHSEMPDRDRFIEAMEKAGWVQAKAARILGLTPRQIGYALKKHNIEVKRL